MKFLYKWTHKLLLQRRTRYVRIISAFKITRGGVCDFESTNRGASKKGDGEWRDNQRWRTTAIVFVLFSVMFQKSSLFASACTWQQRLPSTRKPQEPSNFNGLRHLSYTLLFNCKIERIKTERDYDEIKQVGSHEFEGNWYRECIRKGRNLDVK